MNKNPVREKGKKNIFCPHYFDCLNTVIKKRWSKWSCANCENITKREAETDAKERETMTYYELSTKA